MRRQTPNPKPFPFLHCDDGLIKAVDQRPTRPSRHSRQQEPTARRNAAVSSKGNVGTGRALIKRDTPAPKDAVGFLSQVLAAEILAHAPLHTNGRPASQLQLRRLGRFIGQFCSTGILPVLPNHRLEACATPTEVQRASGRLAIAGPRRIHLGGERSAAARRFPAAGLRDGLATHRRRLGEGHIVARRVRAPPSRATPDGRCAAASAFGAGCVDCVLTQRQFRHSTQKEAT